MSSIPIPFLSGRILSCFTIHCWRYFLYTRYDKLGLYKCNTMYLQYKEVTFIAFSTGENYAKTLNTGYVDTLFSIDQK